MILLILNSHSIQGHEGRRREKSGCSCGKEDDNGGDQEVESTATGGLSLSLFSSAPARTSTGSDRKVLGLDLDKGKKPRATSRASTLDLTI
jgi:hypothetical protein